MQFLLSLLTGVPTSRAGAIVVSEDRVMRDISYDGHPKMEKTAVVLRLAPSWFRFGSFEILAKTQEIDLLRDLLDFIINVSYFYLVFFSGILSFL